MDEDRGADYITIHDIPEILGNIKYRPAPCYKIGNTPVYGHHAQGCHKGLQFHLSHKDSVHKPQTKTNGRACKDGCKRVQSHDQEITHAYDYNSQRGANCQVNSGRDDRQMSCR